jgi:gamma-glutamylcyclotransferase (GGCT)/AIG2-like uncharacterized protein YtfP
MRALTIEAKSLESAQQLYSALSAFHPELVGSDDEGYRVRVELGSFDTQVIEVLDAVERFANSRKSATSLELDGRRYTVEPGYQPDRQPEHPTVA